MVDKTEYCTRCGAKLDPGIRYCPECGLRVPGRNPEAVEADKEAVRTAAKYRPRWAGYIMVIYGIPLLCMGLYYFLDAQGIADMLWQNSSFVEQMESMGITRDMYEQYIVYFGSAWTASGVLAVLSAVLCFMRRYYYIALVLCIISAILAVAGIFALFLGLLAFWVIMSSKLGFKDFEPELEKELSAIK